MNAHLQSAYSVFTSGCTRARNLRAIHKYLSRTAPAALDCDDILRSALVLVVSSFDLFMHDIYRLEVLYRLSTGQTITLARVPFDALRMQASAQASTVEECVRKDNAHKSFVAPDKVAECLRPLISSPWELIAHQLDEEVSSCKEKLRKVVALRNRIAHEADVNPAYGGIELWPIYDEDVGQSISFLLKLGSAIAEALR